MSGKDPDKVLGQLLLIMDALRNPEHGCPWDLEQDFASIAPHTLEETFEVIDAIETGNLKHLESELGDLLFQVVFYARLGQEQGSFDFASIAEGISRKLLQRHPHVFPDGTLASAGGDSEIDSDQVVVNWEQIKAAERRQRATTPVSLLDDIPQALTALLRAAKLQKRAANAGFDWPDSQGVQAKIREELSELEQACRDQDTAAMEEELGDMLFTVVNLGRHLRVEPESALRKANRKFEARFRRMEALLQAKGQEISEMNPDELDSLWQQVKSEERS